ncbi:DUF58 domain-containing protein [Pedobacter sp. HMF7647]|uniref:DUF58 domain-containing protein n=1 Tax=Hufsiella arboris TaxID=2695275 RepID=A0A7K1YF62_9SPHI|nr:DUF58 domain-containing protein [Hufsiella arboris]
MKHKETGHPSDVAVALEDLMRYEFLVQSGNLLPGHPVYSILAGRHASKLRGRGMDFEEVRQYVAGDDIRNIDWKVTARIGETYSKVFNEEKERTTFILLDQGSRMFFGSKRFVKSVSAAHAAAIGAFYTIKRGDRVGGIVFGDEEYDYVAPKRSKALVQHFMQLITKHNRALPERKVIREGPGRLKEMLKRTQAAVSHDFVITIISDFSDFDPELRQQILGLANHNDVILIHIDDEMDEVLPDGKLVLSDGHRQITWQNSHRKWGGKYTERFRDIHQRLSDNFSRYRVPVVYFNTAEAVEDQVMQSMGKRLKRK